MQAHRLSVKAGWSWVIEGFNLFRANPAVLGFAIAGYWLLLLFMDMVPVLGPLVTALCMPAMSVSVMNACRWIDEQHTEKPQLAQVLFSGFKNQPKVLLTLGGLNLLSLIVVLSISRLIDGGALMSLLISGGPPDPELFQDPRLPLSMIMVLLFMVPVLMAFWFAPLLVSWENCGAPKSLFFSFVACWRNGAAFFGYGAGLMLISGVLPGVFLGLLGGISPSLAVSAAALLSVPFIMVFVPTLFASFYVSYRRVFAREIVAPEDEMPEFGHHDDAQQ